MEYIMVNGELYHHGIKGQKWGIRRWQNTDGTFNEAGKIRYFGKKSSHKPDSVRKLDAGSSNTRGGGQKDNGSVQNKKGLSDKQKKALKIGAAVAGTALVAYGAYKLNDKVTKDLFDSYAFVSDVLQESSKSSNKQALNNNKWAYEAKNNGASDSVVSALKDMSDEYRKRRDIDSALSDKYSNKAAFKEFSAKERMDAAKRIITKGSSEFKSQKEKEIWDEATKEFNRRSREADHAKANQELIRKMMDEGIKNGGVQGTYNFSDQGYNNLGFDLRKTTASSNSYRANKYVHPRNYRR